MRENPLKTRQQLESERLLKYAELMDEAGENFCAEVCKHDPDDFPAADIRALQGMAGSMNSCRRESIRALKAMGAQFAAAPTWRTVLLVAYCSLATGGVLGFLLGSLFARR